MTQLFIDVMMITTFALTGFMVTLVISRVDREVIGDKRSWVALIVFCTLMILRSLDIFIEDGWYPLIRPIFGMAAACIFPWALWKFYTHTRIGPGTEDRP